MADETAQSSRDWLRTLCTSVPGWWLPHAALLAALLAPVPARTAVWTFALVWMGLACIANSRRCRRTHCRYTGPYYLAMIVPVLVLGLLLPSAGICAWIILGLVIVGGCKLIWWATERAWGRFS